MSSAKIIDGKILATQVKAKVAKEIEVLKKQGIFPCLQVFLVGDDPASSVYVRGKTKDCEECGIKSSTVRLPQETTQEKLLSLVKNANNDKEVHGILVQLPLPRHINEKAVIAEISPLKDVDGFTAVNTGKLQIGEDCFAPCTPAACIYMVESTGTDLSGKDVVVVGRSNIVGKPLATMLLAKNATVTVCHTKTKNMAEKCLTADIIFAAAGKMGLISADMVKPGALVVDVGMNRNPEGKLCGDVDFASVSLVASAITPVPGGVGLMTRAMLMQNTLKAAKSFAQE